MRLVKFVIGAALCLSAAAPAFAQSVPTTVEPGRVQQDLQRPAAPVVAPPVEVQASPEAKAPAGAEKVSFVLKDVVIAGNTRIATADLEQYYKNLIGQKITLNQVYDVAAQITRHYRNEGYLLSRAVVPEQEVKDGIVSLQVVEGFVSGYQIQGNDVPARSQIESYAQRIVSEGPVKAGALERYLLLMNSVPGVSVRAVLSPSVTVPGGADLTLIPTEDNFRAFASIDNFGNQFLGPERVTLGTEFSGLFSLPNRLSVTGMIAPENNELGYIAGGYRHLVSNEGTEVGIDGSYTHTNPSLPVALGGLLGAKGNAQMLRASIQHPLVRQRTTNLNARASFEALHNSTYYLPAFGILETTDKLRVARIGADGNYVDTLGGYNVVDLTLSQGIEGLGGSEEGDAGLSRPTGDPAFTKISAEVTRLQQIWGPFTGMVGVAGQYSFDPLLVAEEFTLGGQNYGRGYDSSQLTGDQGVAAKLELAYNGAADYQFLKNYQVFVFYDMGTVWREDPGAGINSRDSLASTGIGSRMTFSKLLEGMVFVAKPLTERSNSRPEDSRDWRIQGSLTTNF